MNQKPRVLLSAYACEPGQGSEPGVGWRWANGLAGRVQLQVLTRESNRVAIERAVASCSADDPLRTVEFHFHDLGALGLWLKRKGLLPTAAYYVLWQRSACKRFASLADSLDVVHHLTFCTLLCPGFWKLRHASYVLGPVGAPEVDPRYLPLFGPKAWQQRLRGWVMSRFMLLPWLARLLKSAKAVVPANSATRQLLVSQGVEARKVMLDTGAPDVPGGKASKGADHPGCRFVFAGRLERRKGIELSLRAFAQACEHSEFEASFQIIGDGPDRSRLVGLAEQLGIRDRVEFLGPMSQADVFSKFHAADVFLFTSVRDTSAGVNLEAMACELPVICLAHQGVADITSDACALRLPPGEICETVNRLAEAIRTMASDRGLRQRLGREALRRAKQDFRWDAKFETMTRYYEEADGRVT